MVLHESAENYLEMIWILQGGGSDVRSVDIARALNYTKPSVSRAMSNLKSAGHITMAADGSIRLTESGKRIAQDIYTRHRMITEWLVALGVDEQTATADACRMEHILSEETFQKIGEHVKKMQPETKE